MAAPATPAKEDRKTFARIAWFTVVNILSIGGMLAIFYGVLLAGDRGVATAVARDAFHFFNRFKTLMVLAALSPFLASLLIGQHYARRGRRRRQMMLERQLAEQRAANGGTTEPALASEG